MVNEVVDLTDADHDGIGKSVLTNFVGAVGAVAASFGSLQNRGQSDRGHASSEDPPLIVPVVEPKMCDESSEVDLDGRGAKEGAQGNVADGTVVIACDIADV